MTEKANKKYKDSVFVDLFYEDESAEGNEIALYNALHDEPLPEGTKIRKIRVENVLYMNFKNNISFDVGGKLIVFGEHQSTINENMPLRNLLYIGRAYEQLVPVEDPSKEYIISFLGVASCMDLYVNGSFVGYSEGAHNTAEFDISSYMTAGKTSWWLWYTAGATAPIWSARICSETTVFSGMCCFGSGTRTMSGMWI